MKKFLIAVCLVCIYAFVNAQQEPSLNIPSTPAFSILNFEPASILKPGNLKDLGGDILNSFDANGKLIMNAGMEVSPYWLSSRPYLTTEAYNYPKIGQSILQTLSVSAATIKDSAEGKNKFGLGIRFKLFNGKPNDEYIQKQSELKILLAAQSLFTAGRSLANSGALTSIADAKAFLFDAIDAPDQVFSNDQRNMLKQMAIDLSVKFADTQQSIVAYFEALNNQLSVQQVQGVAEKVYTLSKKRIGFFFEVAGATGFSSKENESSLERAGIWLTTSEYYNSADAWHISARYQFSSRDTSLNNFDIGFAYSKELKKFSISAEGMLRWYSAQIPDFNNNNLPILRLEKDFTYRLALQSAYLITEGLSINISLGKNFSSPFVNADSFFSIFGFSYSLFKKVPVLVKEPASQP